LCLFLHCADSKRKRERERERKIAMRCSYHKTQEGDREAAQFAT